MNEQMRMTDGSFVIMVESCLLLVKMRDSPQKRYTEAGGTQRKATFDSNRDLVRLNFEFEIILIQISSSFPKTKIQPCGSTHFQP